MEASYQNQEVGVFLTPEKDPTTESAPTNDAYLTVYASEGPAFRCLLTSTSFTIGRSAKAGNDLVLETDELCSKRHSVIEKDRDGRFTLYDLGSTNGSKINGERVDNRTLCDGDEIVLGQTRLGFRQTGGRGDGDAKREVLSNPGPP